MSATTHPLAGRRVLVVEDEFFVAMEVKRWLLAAGAEVVGPVPSDEQALDLIDGHALDGAVLDINLGDGATVYAVADRLDAAAVPYLFATGDVSVAPAYADRPLLEKPYTQGDMLRALDGLLGRETVR